MNDKMQDLSYLPHYGYGSRGLAFWGTAGFMLLEGTGFAIAAGVYLYLMVTNPVWPMEQPPGLFWSSLVTIALLASVPANQRTMRNAERENLKASAAASSSCAFLASQFWSSVHLNSPS